MNVFDAYAQVLHSVRSDVCELDKSVQRTILALGILVAISTVLDMNALDDSETGVFVWDIDNIDSTVPAWKRAALYANSIGSFAGIMYMILMSYRKYSTFFWGMMNNLVYLPFTLAYGYLGDAQLALFFIVTQWIGVTMWKNQMNADHTVNVAAMNNWKMYVYIVAMASGLTAFFYWEIPMFSNALVGEYIFGEGFTPGRCIDALTKSMSVTAHILVFWRCNAIWFLWIFSNIGQLIMYSGAVGLHRNINVMVMFTVFTYYSVKGCISWVRLRNQYGRSPSHDSSEDVTLY